MYNPKISAIVAMDLNYGIGYRNTIPWKLPPDMKRFKELTTGHVVIMGHNTWKSLPKPLSNRTNIVLSRSVQSIDGPAVLFHDLEKALEYCKTIERDEIFIIGGEKVYISALPYLYKIYATQIFNRFEVDTYFPEYKYNFTNYHRSEIFKHNNLEFCFADFLA
jgi:dihydrofolate reductase